MDLFLDPYIVFHCVLFFHVVFCFFMLYAQSMDRDC